MSLENNKRLKFFGKAMQHLAILATVSIILIFGLSFAFSEYGKLFQYSLVAIKDSIALLSVVAVLLLAFFKKKVLAITAILAFGTLYFIAFPAIFADLIGTAKDIWLLDNMGKLVPICLAIVFVAYIIVLALMRHEREKTLKEIAKKS